MLAYKKNRKGSRKGSRKASRSASRKASRSASRKASRSASRKTYMRKASRKASRKTYMRKASRSANRKTYMRKSSRFGMYGGAYNPAALSLAQGRDFDAQHKNQHGGAYAPLGGAPVGDQGLLPQELRDMARVTPVDMKNAEIIGMHDPDQMGGMNTMKGGRRKGSRSASRNNMRKSRKSRKANRKNTRKNRKSRKSRRNQGGGARTEMGGAPYDSPNMLLSPSEALKAGTGDFSNPLLKH